ncbi:hypothetical protein HK102_008577, partial [Quaeritorhiza haematococci]
MSVGLLPGASFQGESGCELPLFKDDFLGTLKSVPTTSPPTPCAAAAATSTASPSPSPSTPTTVALTPSAFKMHTPPVVLEDGSIQCTHTGCGKKIATIGKWKAHMRGHKASIERKHVCQMCGATFARRTDVT